MSGITYQYMEDYLRSLIEDKEDILKELEEYALGNNVPIIHKEVGRFLEVIINMNKPLKILELGTAIGYSAILMFLSSAKKAEITTVERDEQMYNKATENICKYGFSENISVVKGDCLEVLRSLEDRFDIIFMDAGKGHYSEFFKESKRLLNKDGIIIADNVLFRGMVATNDLVIRRKITIVKRMRKYLEEINKEEEYITTVIPMGDGIAVTTRRNKNE